ncbi:MAG TPA: hemolysin family protein [Rectinema sp.]|jgi:putative hemolysin|nr:hemolysin family protein [Rectinema sp.]HOC27057.1 hemolysin family protein [Rectinema sp.]HOI98402.1 hemolysin family protein [Rectinema sp.]HPN91886.1 hemolysin family protein [Rectinema sp.]HPW01656.1 hemolysin family protein [Rectinema sp.]
MISEILVLLALIFINGFFSLSETALVSSRKARLKAEADKGKSTYKLALNTRESPSRYLSTIQVAITLIGILTGTISGTTFSQLLAQWLSGWSFVGRYAESVAVAIVVLTITFLSVVIGELVPKSIALRNPEYIAALTIKPMHALSVVFYPVVRFLSSLTDSLTKLFRFSHGAEPAITPEEVRILLEQGEKSGVFETAEREMMEEVLNLDDRRVTMFMTPRTEVVTLNIKDSRDSQIRAIIKNSEYAYLPVVDGDLDHTIGMVAVKRALTCMAEGCFLSLETCMEPAVMIPESLSGLQALAILRDAKRSAGLIVDEFGGISGIVTIADLLEAIANLSEVETEEASQIIKRSDGSYLVDGSMPIDEFAESIGINLDVISNEDYDTVAGFILHCGGSIPKAGDIIEWPPLKMEIVDMDGKRIDKVLVQKSEQSLT